tara:strand:+ start:8142 stop:8690 length:549 start_codon:yes stop_codon:yes gene_type:complete
MSFSSFEKDKKLMEGWRKYTKGTKLSEEKECPAEQFLESKEALLEDAEQLDEALVTAATLAVITKIGTYVIYFAIGQREKINKIVDNLAANKRVPPKVKTFLNKLTECLDAAAEAAPALERAAQMGNSNWNPLSWKQNALMAALEVWTRPGPDDKSGSPSVDSGRDPEWTGSELDEKKNKET